MAEWQPIETAPKDGREVLIWGGTYQDESDWPGVAHPFHGMSIANFDGGISATDDHPWCGNPGFAHDEFRWHAPTHWMPLPPAPDADSGLISVGGE